MLEKNGFVVGKINLLKKVLATGTRPRRKVQKKEIKDALLYEALKWSKKGKI